MTTIREALSHLATLKPGTDKYAKAYQTVLDLREAAAETAGADGIVRETPCVFGTCPRRFQGEVGAESHKSGRKVIRDARDIERIVEAEKLGWIEQAERKVGDRNPLFCQGAADYQAAKALAARK